MAPAPPAKAWSYSCPTACGHSHADYQDDERSSTSHIPYTDVSQLNGQGAALVVRAALLAVDLGSLPAGSRMPWMDEIVSDCTCFCDLLTRPRAHAFAMGQDGPLPFAYANLGLGATRVLLRCACTGLGILHRMTPGDPRDQLGANLNGEVIHRIWVPVGGGSSWRP